MSTGRSFRFELEADSAETALARAEALATRLLANPVMEDTEVSVSSAVPG
jgi:phosphoribosylformylglycinamidine (FGAM) synthase PurS component